jgi:GNAT superfamily N-acetyltransferase
MLSSLTRVPARDAAQVADVLCEAFNDYPVMRYVLGGEADYDARLGQMIGVFVAARALLDDVMLGAYESGELVAVATTSDPARAPHPDFAAMRDAVWSGLGAEASARYQQCVTAWQSMESHVPQLHVNMLGTRAAQRGTGLGRKLLEEVHVLAAGIPGCEGVSLTTETASNVAFYQHLGYEVIGTQQIAPDLQTWSLMRWRTR